MNNGECFFCKMNLGKLLYQNILWRGSNLLSVFILNVLIARIFGAQLYGELFFLINILSLLLLVVSFSLESGLGFYSSQNKLGAATAIGTAATWSVAGAGLTMLILQINYKHAALHETGHFIFYCFLYVTGTLLLTFFSALFAAKFRYLLPNVTVLVFNTAICLLLLFNSLSFERFVQIYFAAAFLQGVVLAAGYSFLYIKNNTVKIAGNAKLAQVLRYSAAAFIANVVFFLVYRVDYWFVNYFVTAKAALGNYIQVSRLGQVFLIIPGIIATTVFSVTAGTGAANVPQKVQQLSRIIFAAAVSGCLLLALTGSWLFPFVFGKSFEGMYMPFLLLIPGIIAIATLYPFTAFNAGNNAIKKNIYGSLFSLVVITAGDFVAVPLFGIAGAAAVSSIGYVTYHAYIVYKFTLETGTRLTDNFKLRKNDLVFLRK